MFCVGLDKPRAHQFRTPTKEIPSVKTQVKSLGWLVAKSRDREKIDKLFEGKTPLLQKRNSTYAKYREHFISSKTGNKFPFPFIKNIEPQEPVW